MASLSILIPTKNRYPYLFHVVEAIISKIKRDDLEIVIQDNSDDNTKATKFFENLADSRVKYFYHSESLPISDNVELAIENATKEYLTIIGDDDFVAPCICDVVDAMKQREIEVLTYDCGYYWWHSVEFAQPSKARQKKAFWIPKITLGDHEFVEIDAKQQLKKMLENGCVSIGDMPRFYHGIVSSKLLEKIKLRAGRYLIASCPDICFSTEIAIVIDTFYHLNYPVTVYGASRDSAAGLGARNAHFAELDKVPFLRAETLQQWNQNIPYVWSPVTTYVQSVSEVLTVMLPNRQVDFSAMYISMLRNERNLMPYIKPAMRRYFARNPLAIFKAIYHIIRKLYSIRYNVRNEDACTIQICDTVDECMKQMPKLFLK